MIATIPPLVRFRLRTTLSIHAQPSIAVIYDVIRTIEMQFDSHAKSFITWAVDLPTSTQPAISFQEPKLANAHPIFGLTPPTAKTQDFQRDCFGHFEIWTATVQSWS